MNPDVAELQNYRITELQNYKIAGGIAMTPPEILLCPISKA